MGGTVQRITLKERYIEHKRYSESGKPVNGERRQGNGKSV